MHTLVGFTRGGRFCIGALDRKLPLIPAGGALRLGPRADDFLLGLVGGLACNAPSRIMSTDNRGARDAQMLAEQFDCLRVTVGPSRSAKPISSWSSGSSSTKKASPDIDGTKMSVPSISASISSSPLMGVARTLLHSKIGRHKSSTVPLVPREHECSGQLRMWNGRTLMTFSELVRDRMWWVHGFGSRIAWTSEDALSRLGSEFAGRLPSLGKRILSSHTRPALVPSALPVAPVRRRRWNWIPHPLLSARPRRLDWKVRPPLVHARVCVHLCLFAFERQRLQTH